MNALLTNRLLTLVGGLLIGATVQAQGVTWSPLVPKKAKEECVLPFEIKQRLISTIGDVDIITNQMGKRKNKDLLLTIESLVDRSPLVTPLKISSGKFNIQSFSGEVSVPCVLGSKAYGVYLCSDDSKIGRCGEKPPALMNSLLPNPNPLSDPSDKIYYFGVLLSRPHELGVLPALDKDRYEFLGKELAKLGFSQAQQSMVTRKVQSLNDKIVSFPIHIAQGRIVHTLGRTVYTFKKKRRLGKIQ